MASRGVREGSWVFVQDNRCDYIGIVLETHEFGFVLGSPTWVCRAKLSELYQEGWKSTAKMDDLCKTLRNKEHWIQFSWTARVHPWPHGPREK